MKRRQFLGHAAGACASFALAPYLSSCAAARPVEEDAPNPGGALLGLRLIDAHAHPGQFYSASPKAVDASSTVDSLVQVGACASVFAAVGDLEYLEWGAPGGMVEYSNTIRQLGRVATAAASGHIRLIKRSSDIPQAVSAGRAPAALLAVEGGDALCGKAELVGDLYEKGVRMLSLVHYRNNELGDVMSARPGASPGWPNGGITPAGRAVIERMEGIGMVVDVAHLDARCLKEAAAVCRKPLIDSHTSPKPAKDAEDLPRLRTWEEMESIAKTGGVVCTWPYAYTKGKASRRTFRDWAAEISEMMSRLGTEHVGLGTDGGGNLPARVSGYSDVRDLGKLATAMRGVGLSEAQLTAYFGGNFFRVLDQCMAT